VFALFISVSFLFFASYAHAAITVNSATKVVPFAQGIKSGSTQTAVIGLNLVGSSSETLNSVTVKVNGSASTDLASLTTATSSGVALYKDNKSLGQFGRFDAFDTLVPLSNISAWSAGATTTLTIATPEVVPTNDSVANTGSDYFVVVRTASGAVEGHAFTLSISPGVQRLTTSRYTNRSNHKHIYDRYYSTNY